MGPAPDIDVRLSGFENQVRQFEPTGTALVLIQDGSDCWESPSTHVEQPEAPKGFFSRIFCLHFTTVDYEVDVRLFERRQTRTMV